MQYLISPIFLFEWKCIESKVRQWQPIWGSFFKERGSTKSFPCIICAPALKALFAKEVIGWHIFLYSFGSGKCQRSPKLFSHLWLQGDESGNSSFLWKSFQSRRLHILPKELAWNEAIRKTQIASFHPHKNDSQYESSFIEGRRHLYVLLICLKPVE